MDKIFFWNNWNNEHKKLYLSLLGIFLLSIFFLVYSYWTGTDAAIHVHVNSVMEPLMTSIDRFSLNLFDFKVDVESYVIKENYQASDIKVNLLSSWIFFGFFLVALIVGVTVGSFLESMSYYIGIGILMLVIVTLNTELLNLFGLSDRIPAGCLIALFGGMSYYFHSFKKNMNFTRRLIAFSMAAFLCACLIAFKSGVASPVLYLSNFGITSAVLLTIFFILLNGFEFIHRFVYMAAGSRLTANNKSRLINFIVISLLYLTNILLVLLKKMLVIDWNIFYVNPFMLYVISSLLGIWGYKKRSVLFKDMIRFLPLGGLWYLCLGIIANATIAYSFLTANDPLTECFEYAIIYSHVFFETVFFLYVIINFGSLFYKNISVSDIVYQPMNVPFFMVRGIGGAGILALFMYSNKFALSLGLAGYFNLAGDVFKHENNLPLAKEYYFSGLSSEFQNHRSNYSLATIAALENNPEKQLEYYSGSLIKRAFEYSYLNLGNLYLKEDAYFQALFILREGLQKFPESSYIANNLAMVYSRTRILDSTLHYLHLAKNKGKAAVPAANMLYVLLKKGLAKEADTLLIAEDYQEDLVFQSNKIAALNMLMKPYPGPAPQLPAKDSLWMHPFALAYNHGINTARNRAASLSLQELDSLISNPVNMNFAEALQFLKVVKLYYSGNKREAFTMLENIRNTSENLYYSKVSAIWMLEQGANLPAAENFKRTLLSGGAAASLNYGVSLSEAGKFEEALPILQQLEKMEDAATQTVASQLTDILTASNIDSILRWPDDKKVRFLHLRKHTEGQALLEIVYNSMQTDFFQKLAAAELADFWLIRGNASKADSLCKNLLLKPGGTSLADGMLNMVSLRILLDKNKWPALQTAAAKIYLTADKENTRAYFLAKAAAGEGKKVDAQKLYERLLKEAPYFEEGIVAAVDFFNETGQPMRAYEVLVDAVQFDATSGKLLKAYCLQALTMNLTSFADDGLLKLSTLIPTAEYSEFETNYQKKKQELEKGE